MNKDRMNIPALPRYLALLLFGLTLYSCTSTRQATEETQSTSRDTVNFANIVTPPEDWHHLDKKQNAYPGISSQKAYRNILKKKEPSKKIILAVIDSGIDPEHEDLSPIIWTNKDEVSGNQKDDDNNGYVDDVNGWNFIGGPDGKNVDHDTFELTRIYTRLKEQFSDVDTTRLDGKELDEYRYFQQIRADYEDKVIELVQQYENIQSLEGSIQQGRQILDQYFGEWDYEYLDIKNLEADSRELQFAQEVMMYAMENDIDSAMIAEQKKRIYEQAKFGYNPDFNPRPIVQDDYSDKQERYYGNNDIQGPDARHGTHVAGIIAAVRSNSIGMDGVSNHTEIMPVRAVPDGDERDKDVANAIRYAVDNGADIINMSFGKGYSPYKEVVDEAVKYAEENGVLMVHGAGNESSNSDENPKYPTRYYEDYLSEPSNQLWLNVGATSWNPEDGFVANFSNYGENSVHLFAPGDDIYSTTPDNSYERLSGTSMASPVVAGTAALIMAYYPELTAAQVKEILLSSSVKYDDKMVALPGQSPNQEGSIEKVKFGILSQSDGVINVYEAVKAAEELSKTLSSR